MTSLYLRCDNRLNRIRAETTGRLGNVQGQNSIVDNPGTFRLLRNGEEISLTYILKYHITNTQTISSSKAVVVDIKEKVKNEWTLHIRLVKKKNSTYQ
jgi:hypothetical protein